MPTAVVQVRRNLKYWKWRPSETVPTNPRLWWHYAIACHLESIRERNENCTWSATLRKCRENVVYVEAFKRHLDNPVTVDAELRTHMEKMDRRRSYDELKALRELAVFKLKREKGEESKEEEDEEEAEEGVETEDGRRQSVSEEEKLPSPTPPAPSLLQQYFPSWAGWYSAPSSTQDQSEEEEGKGAAVPSHELSANVSTLEEELLEVLADEVNLVPYKDVVFAQLSFRLKRGSLSLRSETPTPTARQQLFKFDFDDVKLEMETRPRTKSYRLAMALGALSLRDCITPNSVFPLLVSPQSTQGAPLSAGGGGGVGGLGNIAKSFTSLLPAGYGGGPSETPTEPLFSLLYETRPFVTQQRSQRVDFR